MQHSKKQKLELQNRKTLKTILNLEPNLISFFTGKTTKENQRLISKTYTNHYYLQTLRILTLMEINYLVSSYIQLTKKVGLTQVCNIKIGIIGGGVFGRLLLNTLIVFTKQGINLKNITVSSRQPNHLQWYADNFGIQLVYDNQSVAQNSDLLFITTPATLDNWIISDIKKTIDKQIEKINVSIKNSYRSTTTVRDLDLKATQSIQKGTISIKNTQTLLKNTKSSFNLSNKQSEFKKFNKIVYITTSDFTDQKCKRVFSFPVLSPWIRSVKIQKLVSQIQNMPQINTTLYGDSQTKQIEQTSLNKMEKLIQIFESYLASKIKNQQVKQINKDAQPAKSHNLNVHFQRILQTLKYSAQKAELKLKQDLLQNIRSSQRQKKGDDLQNSTIVDEVFCTQGDQISTFLARNRKWRMAYHNFIS